MLKNVNTNCRGSCNRFVVDNTSTVEKCINICKARGLCRYYIWHKMETKWPGLCMVVEEGEGGWGLDVSRRSDRNTITGTCKKGSD